jgi:uncharacterized YigZ family protein
MPVFSFLTIALPAEGSYKEKGSKFLAFAYPVSSETEIKEKVAVLKVRYFDARHHCYAWILGTDKKHFRANDDGEPNHSAGDSILGQLRAMKLTNVLIVVVRYFGGIKLGVGGLITAYRSAAEEALRNTTIVEREVCEKVLIFYPYSATTEAMRLVKDFELTIKRQDFTEGCSMDAEIPIRHKEKFTERINLMKAMGVSIDSDSYAR